MSTGGLCSSGRSQDEAKGKGKKWTNICTLPENRKKTFKVIPIVVGGLGTVPKSLGKIEEELEIRGRIETIQTTALLKSARILRRVMET